MARDWRIPLWNTFRQRAESNGTKVRFPVFFQGRADRRSDVTLVGDQLRVPITPATIEELDSLPKDYATRLKNDSHRRAWENAAKTVRANVNTTATLNAYGQAVRIPIDIPNRTTTHLNVYAFFHVEPEDLADLLEPHQAAALRNLRKQRKQPLRLTEVGKLLFPAEDAEDAEEPELDEGEEEEEEESVWSRHRNVIFFGPPGTGKSHWLQQIVDEHLHAPAERMVRVTFHPETSYYDFVGSFRPAVGWLRTSSTFVDADGASSDREPRTYYRFEPGPLSHALAIAAESPDVPAVLVIEEINRGNCAAIFGDVLQLLDRLSDPERPDELGWSEYPIQPSSEWAGWLRERLPASSRIFERQQRRLRLPRNLYIYATMNTSDQSLYPMDTAFRRRWGMEYHGVDKGGDSTVRVRLHAKDTQGVSWLDLMRTLNEAIVAHTQTDDKQLGPWFVRPPAGSPFVDTVEFKSKVLFYLWSNVFRDHPTLVFQSGVGVTTYERLVARYDAGQHVYTREILASVGAVDAKSEVSESSPGALSEHGA